jgi:hypothetical protein
MKNLLDFRGWVRVCCVALAFGTLAGAGQAFSLTIQPIQDPSAYSGTLKGELPCDTNYDTAGYEPYDSSRPNAKYPLFLYFIGTAFNAGESRDYYKDAPAPRAALQAMAARGFVAVTVQYDNTVTSFFDNSLSIAGFKNKQACLFGATNPNNLLAALCARRNVNCSTGIGIFGHSQGGEMALAAGNHDKRVNAVFATGDAAGSGLEPAIAYNRIRLVNGEHDLIGGYTSGMYALTGTNWLDCAGQGHQCLRADGSGWIMVRQAQLASPSLPFYSHNIADHCWFYSRACGTTDVLEPQWTPGTTYPFSLAATADWLAATAVTSRICPAALVALRSNASNLYVSARLLDAGVPLRASALFAAPWERFACMEKGNGRITLQANNGLYVAANGSGGYQLVADADEAGATVFQYVDIGSNKIALKAISNGKYVATDFFGQIAASQGLITRQATFTLVPQ